MNETYIQTIRGGIQRVINLAKDHWTQEPKRCGFNYHHELYGYIPVCKLSKLIREARNETWEEYAWLCYENRYLTLGADGCTDAGVRKLYKVFHDAVRNL